MNDSSDASPGRPETAAELRGSVDSHQLIKGRRWRRTDPAIDAELRQSLVNELMAARRAVKAAKSDATDHALVAARSRVNDAKVALGERGPKWWEPMTADDIEYRISCCRRAVADTGDVEASDDLAALLALDASQLDVEG